MKYILNCHHIEHISGWQLSKRNSESNSLPAGEVSFILFTMSRWQAIIDSLSVLYYHNKKIGFIFQSFNILTRTTAIENVELPLLYDHRVSSKERRQRAFEALKSVGLEHKVNSLPNQLSGGQQQRVAIARALVNNPLIIMADEPTGNLDSKTSIEIMQLFQELNKKGITIVMVTHETDIAGFALSTIVFKDGKIILNEKLDHQKDAEAELRNYPTTTKTIG